jgi:NADH-quinone oxidoreductase subunit D
MKEKITIPIGPQHPLLKEPLSLRIDISGEEVLGGTLRLGYVHRGIEKLAESRNYTQNIPLIERICGICSHVHTTTFCYAVEALLGIEIPPRAQYIRALLCELERIHSHLLWLGVLAKHVGLETVFMHSWHDRELVLDIMEELSGGRVSHGINQIGGVRFDVDEEHHPMMAEKMEKLHERISQFTEIFKHEPSIKARTHGVAPLSPDLIRQYGLVGPVARASGVDIDMRRDDPLPPYDQLDFNVITHPDGDAWSRTYVRIYETYESLLLCEKILQTVPEGEISTRARRKVPAGEVVVRSEAPRGEVVYYLRANDTEFPARLKIRTPTLPALAIMPRQLAQIHVADIPVVLAGVDLCIACADR